MLFAALVNAYEKIGAKEIVKSDKRDRFWIKCQARILCTSKVITIRVQCLRNETMSSTRMTKLNAVKGREWQTKEGLGFMLLQEDSRLQDGNRVSDCHVVRSGEP